MKPIIRTLVGLLFLLSSAATLQGQSQLIISFSQNTVSGQVNDMVDVHVVANKFQNIITMQYPVRFNPAILEVVSVTVPGPPPPLPGLNYVPPPGSGTIVANNTLGRVNVSWFESTGTPFTVADNTTLFTIKFRVKAVGTSDIYIASAPGAPVEVTGTGGTPAAFTYPTIVIPPCQNATTFAIAPTPENVAPGQLACLPFQVNDFNQVVSMQYGVTWNSSVLTFSHVQCLNLPDLDCTNFNATQPGRLVFQWNDASFSGVTLPDCASIFEVCFTAATTPGNTTISINSAGLPLGSPASAENAAGSVIWVNGTGIAAPMSVISGTPVTPQTLFFDVPQDTIDGADITIPIRVKNFKNISEFSFVLSFDDQVLSYSGLVGTALSQLNSPPPATQAVTVTPVPGVPGSLQVRFLNPTTLGVTLADNQIVLNLRFAPANGAAPNSLSNITIGSLTSPNIPFNAVEGSNASTAACRFLRPQKDDGFIRTSANAAPVIAVVNKTDVTCFGANNGSIDISITAVAGGSGPSINWSNTLTNVDPEDLTNLGPGTYTVTVTGNMGLTSTLSVTITGPTADIAATAASVTNVTCFGGSNGAVALTTTGGTAPYTWNWSHTQAVNSEPEDLSGVPANTYTLTITDSRNCQKTVTYTVTSPTVPIALATSNVQHVRCLDGNTGGVNLAVQNANTSGAGVTYAWRSTTGTSNISTAQNPNNLPAGTYNVTITDGVGCTATLAQPVTIQNAPSALVVPTATTTNPSCATSANGAICLNTPSGGWGGYTVQWNNATLSGLCPQNAGVGTYTATVTDAGGCTAVRSANLTAAPAVTLSNTNVTNVTCHNQGNGSITVTPTGAFNSIAWSGPNGPAGSGTTISNLGGGNYVATITYANNVCSTVSSPIAVDNPQPIVVMATTTQQNLGTPGSIDLTVTGGVGTYTYAWTNNLAPTQDQAATPAGTYTVTITDQRGCAKIETIVVTNACIICGSSAVTEAACEDDGCIEVTIPTGTPGPYLITWAGPETGSVPFNNQLNYSLCGLVAGPYSVTLTDGSGQTTVLPVSQTTIAQRPPVQLTGGTTDPTLANSNGSIVLTPGPGLALEYTWITPVPLPGSPVQFNLDSGTYIVQVRNLLPGGCTKEYEFTLVRQYPPITCNTVATQPTCATSSNGAINLTVNGGDNIYTYAWSNNATTQDLANLAQGTYSVTVTDGRGITQVCTPAGGDVLTAASQLAVSNVNETSNYNGFQVSGAISCDGAANVIATGATGNVTYQWSNGATTAQTNTLCGGTYAVTVTDNAGCTSTWTGELTAPEVLTGVSTILTDFNGFGVSCFERCDGLARVNLSGGVAPYVIRWPSGRTEQVNLSGGASIEDDLCGGSYTVTITDANGIITPYTFNVAEPPAIEFSFADVAPSTLANCDAEIIASTTGTVGTATYTWVSQFSQGTGERAEDLCAEEVVTFTVVDANNCTASATYEVPFPPEECFAAVPVLTPNDDGDNDYFVLKCIQDYPNTVEVFDRWNQAVTPKFTNYQNTWDGTRNGQPLPEGVYFYIATFANSQGQEIKVTGYVNLLR
jgi:gliding motility-associated-like protein